MGTPQPPPQPLPQPQLLLISPVRNEGAHIARVARAVAAQSTPPARWVVIDDSSSDDTLAQLEALSEELPFMTLMRAPEQAPGARDRLARAVEARNFNLALAHATAGPPPHSPPRSSPHSSPHSPPRSSPHSSPRSPSHSFTHVMKLDGDVELPPDYLRSLLGRFAADPELGVAGGVLVEPAPGGEPEPGGEERPPRPIKVPRHHVHGALKCWTHACLTAIGGVSERLGWDTIDETYARMRGFRTHSFTDLVCIHHRPLASADGALRGHARHGECAYIVHYGPLWVSLRALKVAARRPRGLSGVAFLFGYVNAAARRRVTPVADPAYRAFTRRELRRRMLRAAGVMA